MAKSKLKFKLPELKLSENWRTLVVFLAPFFLLPIPLAIGNQESRGAYVVLLMALYWLSECLPLPVTALLPVFLYPMLEVASTSQICINYMKDVMMMTLGSLFLGVALEKHRSHERIALKMLLWIGTSPPRLLLGFLSTAAILSTITTNAATASMLVPVVQSLSLVLNRKGPADEEGHKNLAFAEDINLDEMSSKVTANLKTEPRPQNPSKDKQSNDHDKVQIALLLAVAYGTSVGGTATITGAAPNLLLKSLLDRRYPDYKKLTYGSWMLYNLPGAAAAVICIWTVLFIIYLRKHRRGKNATVESHILKQYKDLGPISPAEKSVACLFLLLTGLWFFSDPGFMPGWKDNFTTKIGSATPAVFVAILLFAVPSGKGQGVLDWTSAQEKTPWGILLLLGGGLAMADGAERSGLMRWISYKLDIFSELPAWSVVSSLCLVTVFLTEFTSNTSTASLILPVIDKMAQSMQLHPVYLLVPVTICSSYAFMLPMATSPNAIVSQRGNMKTKYMAFPGFFLNICGCIIQIVAIHTFGTYVFDLNSHFYSGEGFVRNGTNATQL